MYVIAADDESLILGSMVKLLQAVFPDAQIRGFGTAKEVESFVRGAAASSANIAYAFLDLRLRGENGLQLAKAIKDLSPHTKIVFSTAYANYSFGLRGDGDTGFIMKPATEDDVRNCVATLDDVLRREPSYRGEFPTDASNGRREQLMIRTFGDFEVFHHGRPMSWDSRNAKDLLALLIHARSKPLTNAQIADALWPIDGRSTAARDADAIRTDRQSGCASRPKHAFASSLRVRGLVKSLRHTLRTVHPQAGGLIRHSRNATSFSMEPIDGLAVHCDLFDMMHGSAYAVNTYYGEYLPSYPWASFPTADLDPDR
ncbi:response regulator [Bifidobacterium moukalabense]|uniref:response regulator n=1 Tax=Bifidobacterium moukalabense TaxID=1333651 RepID=UPI0010F8A115|nr:response regulator [Bifidobacterium moukalabense]